MNKTYLTLRRLFTIYFPLSVNNMIFLFKSMKEFVLNKDGNILARKNHVFETKSKFGVKIYDIKNFWSHSLYWIYFKIWTSFEPLWYSRNFLTEFENVRIYEKSFYDRDQVSFTQIIWSVLSKSRKFLYNRIFLEFLSLFMIVDSLLSLY